MAQLTHKELILQDNIKMCQESVQFLQACMNMVNDPQLKTYVNRCYRIIEKMLRFCPGILLTIYSKQRGGDRVRHKPRIR